MVARSQAHITEPVYRTLPLGHRSRSRPHATVCRYGFLCGRALSLIFCERVGGPQGAARRVGEYALLALLREVDDALAVSVGEVAVGEHAEGGVDDPGVVEVVAAIDDVGPAVSHREPEEARERRGDQGVRTLLAEEPVEAFLAAERRSRDRRRGCCSRRCR